jgi:hypothetical protein
MPSRMATSIKKPVKQQIANYRLTAEIIEDELQEIFPGYAVSAFKVKVSDSCSSRI